jgi:hypothetical protein
MGIDYRDSLAVSGFDRQIEKRMHIKLAVLGLSRVVGLFKVY